MSHDFEDIIYIIDNRSDLPTDMAKADFKVQSFLKRMSDDILSHFSVNEIIECHLNPLVAKERREIIVEYLKKIKNL